MTTRNLVVLLGAGASYDCLDNLPYVDREFRPPLTKEIFEPRSRFLQILRKYPGASALADAIRTAVDRGKPLERVIRDGLNSNSKRVRRHYVQVALYIQELIGTVSSDFAPMHSTRFHSLVKDVEERLGKVFDKVLYLSLNYDGFMEKALFDFYGVRFATFGEYLAGNGWSLVKLHGSANWGFPYLRAEEGVQTLPEDDQFRKYLDALRDDDNEPKPALADLMIVGSAIERSRFIRYHNGHFIYPAIAAPVEGKTEYVCPIEHSQHAEKLVAECTDFLVLGCAIMDLDVHVLLSKMKNVRRLFIVNGTYTGLYSHRVLKIGSDRDSP
jgi:hypothetical protein